MRGKICSSLTSSMDQASEKSLSFLGQKKIKMSSWSGILSRRSSTTTRITRRLSGRWLSSLLLQPTQKEITTRRRRTNKRYRSRFRLNMRMFQAIRPQRCLTRSMDSIIPGLTGLCNLRKARGEFPGNSIQKRQEFPPDLRRWRILQRLWRIKQRLKLKWEWLTLPLGSLAQHHWNRD